MSETTTRSGNQPLGVGSLLGESLSIFFRKIIPITLISLLPLVVVTVFTISTTGDISGEFGGFDPSSVAFNGPEISGGFVVASIIVSIVILVLYVMSLAVIVQLAYDAKLNRRLSYVHYFRRAFSVVVVCILLSAAVMIGVFLFMLLGFLGISLVFSIAGAVGIILMPVLYVIFLWLMAVFSVMIPAVVIEGAGFRGLHRSAFLTWGYRWPIVGVFVLMFILTIVMSLATLFLQSLLLMVVGDVVSQILSGVLTAGIGGLFFVLIALIYARLREIKEGVSVDQLASVFD